MSYSISWVAFCDASKERALELTSLRDLGTDDEFYESSFCCGRVGRWVVVCSDDVMFAESALGLSAKGLVVSCQVEETAMLSAVQAFESGVELWSVWRDGQKAGSELVITGKVPTELAAIMELFRQELVAGVDPVDAAFEVPLRLAKALTGFRHDEQIDADVRFTAAEPLVSVE